MPLRFGAHWPTTLEPAHAGYTRVTPRADGRPNRGILTGFQITCGRPDGQYGYVGTTAQFTIEGWDFTQASTPIGTPIALRWDSGDTWEDINDDAVRWPNGPPCLFQGWVLSHDVRHIPGADGESHTIVTLQADDWLGSWSHQTPWQVDDEPSLRTTIQDWLFNTEGARAQSVGGTPINQIEGVVLGSWTDSSGVAHDDPADWEDLSIGEAIQAVAVSTGTEIFMRHGDRLGVYAGSTPPSEHEGAYTDALGDSRGRARGKFFIRSPQLVVRQIGGPTTYDVTQVSIDDDDGNGTNLAATPARPAQTFNPTGAGSDPETHLMPRRRVLDRAREIEVLYPAPLDRVTLFGVDYDPEVADDAQPRQFAESVTRAGGREREFVEYGGLPIEDNAAFDGHLQIVADRLRSANTNVYRVYRVEIENLSDDEMHYWAGIGIGDEVVLPRPDGTIQSQGITQVRQYIWQGTVQQGIMLTLWLAYHPGALEDPEAEIPAFTPEREALWEGVITWVNGPGGHAGFDDEGGAQEFGALNNHFLFLHGETTDFRAILRRHPGGEVRIVTATPAGLTLIDNLYLRLELPGLADDIWLQVEADGTNVWDSYEVIADADRPPTSSVVVASLWDSLPDGVRVTPELGTDPQEELWSATIRWGSSGANSGWTTESPAFGSIDDDEFTPDALEVTFTRIIRTGSGRVLFEVGSEAQYNELEGKWFRLEYGNEADDQFVVQIPPRSGDLYQSSEGEIVVGDVPDDHVGVHVSVWTRDPTFEDRTDLLPAPVVPNLRGLTGDQARAEITGAGFTVGPALAETDVEDQALNDRVQTQQPALGTPAAPDSPVRFGLGRLVVPNLDNHTETDARADLMTAGLVASPTDVNTETQSLDNTVVTGSQSPAAGSPVQPGDTVTFQLYNYAAAPVDPQKLRDMVLTWGSHSANVPRHGFSLSPPDDEAYGALTNRTITIGSTVVEITRLAELGNPGQNPPDPNDGRVRIDVGNHDQAEALAGNWIRIEPTTDTADDVIFQVPEPDGTDAFVQTAAGTFPSDDTPADTTRIAVSVWDLQPVSQPATPMLPRVPVPDLDPLTETDARAAILAAGLTVGDVDSEVTNTESLDDQVVDDSQSPSANTLVEPGSEVTFTSYMYEAPAPQQVTIPLTILGMTEDAARQTLSDLGLLVAADTTDEDTLTISANNTVQGSSPAVGTAVDVGSEVALVLWNFNGVVVPNLVGQTATEAAAALTALGLVGAPTDTDTTTFEENDDVLTQNPVSGTDTGVAAGSTIAYTVGNWVPFWSSVLTWGSTDTFGGWGSDHGSLADATIDIDGTDDVTLLGINRTIADGTVTVSASSATEYDDLQGKWLRIEPTDSTSDDVIFQFPDSDTAAGSVTGEFPAAAVPADNTQVAVSIWDADPTGQPATAGYPIDPPVTTPTMLTTAEITVGNTGTWFGWRDSPTMGSVDPDPWQFNHDGHLVRVTRLEMRSTNGQIRLWVNDNTDAAEIENDLWVRLILPDRDTAVVFQLPSRNDNKFTIPNAVQPTSDVPAVGETVTAEFWDAQPSTTIAEPDPVKLWSTELTWGIHPDANIHRGGYATTPADSQAYGSLTTNTIPADDNFAVAVTIERFAELFDANAGKVRIDTGSSDEYNALEGKWIRLETTGQPGGDVIFEIPTSGDSGQTTGVVFQDDSDPPVAIQPPAAGTRVALSIWDRDPRGQDATENLPVDPVQALWSGTITWQRAGGQGGWRSTGGSPYGNISPSPVTFARGPNSITVTDLYRWGNNNMRFGTGNHAGNYAAAEGLWIKFELEDGDVVAQVSDQTLGTTLASCTPVGRVLRQRQAGERRPDSRVDLGGRPTVTDDDVWERSMRLAEAANMDPMHGEPVPGRDFPRRADPQADASRLGSAAHHARLHRRLAFRGPVAACGPRQEGAGPMTETTWPIDGPVVINGVDWSHCIDKVTLTLYERDDPEQRR